MNHYFRLVAVMVLVSVLAAATAFAQSPPVADTYVTSANPNQNFGHDPMVTLNNQSRTYMRFNLVNIPPNATVQKATLRLYVDGFLEPGTFDVYEIDQPWNEWLITWNNAPPLGMSATGNNSLPIT